MSFVIVFSTLFLGYEIFWITILKGLPQPKELSERNVEISTKIYDRNGMLLYKIYKNKNRTPVKLIEVPLQVKLATLAAEDGDFYNHPGFSIRGIVRAIFKYLKEDKLTGGSTITQQLVKNALLSPEKTLRRKLKEIVLATRVEREFSKDEILEMYLNEVSYGGTAYGIGEAARVYFNKDLDELSLAESAILAGLPKSPTRFSPFGANPDSALSRQKEVLNLMYENTFITYEQMITADEEKLSFATNKTEIAAPHFVMYVREQLVNKYGEAVVETGGLEVTTTLDFSIQKMVEEVVKEEIDKLGKFHVTNGAALVIDTKTGEVLAMVGSRDYFDTKADGNVNVLTRLRQPGSSIKIVNYAYALSNGYTAATVLNDSPITFNMAGSPPYSPKNYDGNFRGNLPLRNALAESRNVPAVRVLASYGVAKMIKLGTEMGITTWGEPSNYGLSLTLGGGDIKLIDLARAYATIANYGKRPKISSILTVANYGGKRLYAKDCSNESSSGVQEGGCELPQVIDPRVAFILIDILKDNNARSPAFGSRSALVIPNHAEVAVKTGTSNEMRDNLTIGFNQKYLVATWVGNNDNSPMNRIASGITGAAPIWNRIMGNLLVNESNHPWEAPSGLLQIPICTLTGTLPCEGCPTRMEWFLEENQPKSHCNLESLDKKEEERGNDKKNKDRGRILEPAFFTRN